MGDANFRTQAKNSTKLGFSRIKTLLEVCSTMLFFKKNNLGEEIVMILKENGGGEKGRFTDRELAKRDA